MLSVFAESNFGLKNCAIGSLSTKVRGELLRIESTSARLTVVMENNYFHSHSTTSQLLHLSLLSELIFQNNVVESFYEGISAQGLSSPQNLSITKNNFTDVAIVLELPHLPPSSRVSFTENRVTADETHKTSTLQFIFSFSEIVLAIQKNYFVNAAIDIQASLSSQVHVLISKNEFTGRYFSESESPTHGLVLQLSVQLAANLDFEMKRNKFINIATTALKSISLQLKNSLSRGRIEGNIFSGYSVRPGGYLFFLANQGDLSSSSSNGSQWHFKDNTVTSVVGAWILYQSSQKLDSILFSNNDVSFLHGYYAIRLENAHHYTLMSNTFTNLIADVVSLYTTVSSDLASKDLVSVKLKNNLFSNNTRAVCLTLNIIYSDERRLPNFLTQIEDGIFERSVEGAIEVSTNAYGNFMLRNIKIQNNNR